MKTSLKLGLLLATLLAPSLALADGPGTSQGTQPGYEYRFTDESLLADGLGPKGAVIMPPHHVVRCPLIRPRVAFVPEMLKSVENL